MPPCTFEGDVGFVLGCELEKVIKLVVAAILLKFLMEGMLSMIASSKIRTLPSRSHFTSLPFVESETKVIFFSSTVCAVDVLPRSARVAIRSRSNLIVKK